MNEGTGIYFHPESAALSRVEDRSLELGSGWLRISDDFSLGLLDARGVIKERGLAEATTSIDWLEMTTSSWEQQRRVSRLIGEFQRDSGRSREMEQGKQGFLQRLMAGLGSALRLRES